jgi:hypothetical protein
MERVSSASELLFVEVFAAKDLEGGLTGLAMTVPCHCGLNQANSLRIDGFSVLAVRSSSILPLNLPALSTQSRSDFLAWSKTGEKLAVAEFMATGMLDAYFLDLVFVGS